MGDNAWDGCSENLRSQLKPTPRTCKTCGLGPCQFTSDGSDRKEPEPKDKYFRTTITVPPGLKERMDKVGGINWSAVASEAFEAAIKRREVEAARLAPELVDIVGWGPSPCPPGMFPDISTPKEELPEIGIRVADYSVSIVELLRPHLEQLSQVLSMLGPDRARCAWRSIIVYAESKSRVYSSMIQAEEERKREQH